jgi:hypothetical protein
LDHRVILKLKELSKFEKFNDFIWNGTCDLAQPVIGTALPF